MCRFPKEYQKGGKEHVGSWIMCLTDGKGIQLTFLLNLTVNLGRFGGKSGWKRVSRRQLTRRNVPDDDRETFQPLYSSVGAESPNSVSKVLFSGPIHKAFCRSSLTASPRTSSVFRSCAGSRFPQAENRRFLGPLNASITNSSPDVQRGRGSRLLSG